MMAHAYCLRASSLYQHTYINTLISTHLNQHIRRAARAHSVTFAFGYLRIHTDGHPRVKAHGESTFTDIMVRGTHSFGYLCIHTDV